MNFDVVPAGLSIEYCRAGLGFGPSRRAFSRTGVRNMALLFSHTPHVVTYFPPEPLSVTCIVLPVSIIYGLCIAGTMPFDYAEYVTFPPRIV
jgi:hypothetical protein